MDSKLGYLVLRLAVGLNLFGHGFVRLFGNYAGFREWLLKTMAPSMMPEILLELSGWVIPPLELVLGVLLLIGFRTREALLGASVLMLGLIFGTCLIQNWEILGLQMFYILLYAILLSFRSHNSFALDK